MAEVNRREMTTEEMSKQRWPGPLSGMLPGAAGDPEES